MMLLNINNMEVNVPYMPNKALSTGTIHDYIVGSYYRYLLCPSNAAPCSV
jgi:hypothetical protein